jgi:hypothetical protein
MTYSNTNKDKTQSGRWQKAKQVVFYVVLGYVIYSSVANIYRQWSTLKVANQRQQTLEKRLNELEKEKKVYERLTEESTSSATIDRNQRQYFGLGGENDVWLVLPKDEANEKIVDQITMGDTKPNLVKWWNLLTNGIL